MRYLKLFESFTLPKYENDYKKIISFKEKIKKKKSELIDMNNELSKMEKQLNKNHNLPKMLEYILEKVKNNNIEHFTNNGERGTAFTVDILEILPKSRKMVDSTSNPVDSIFIEVYDDEKEDYVKYLVDEIVYDGVSWVFKNYDNYGDPIYTEFNSLSPDTLYKIIKVLMNDPVVITSINNKAFKNINH